ncbi:hypothetical protein TNCV_4292451 [Trichonephila clavipes]|uniref:Uncharacterized protein n=1 Tax=Trichonephila clavipes TaxID=2585209 RepID=A0A8X6RPP8_TRICX|nr:hypothetical protein TNCV_4292451 [Trichonephila clavipes]
MSGVIHLRIKKRTPSPRHVIREPRPRAPRPPRDFAPDPQGSLIPFRFPRMRAPMIKAVRLGNELDNFSSTVKRLIEMAEVEFYWRHFSSRLESCVSEEASLKLACLIVY